MPYDGNDPAYEDLYLPNREHYEPDRAGELDIATWYTGNTK